MTKPKHRQVDFSKYKRRHIALRILYFGWDCDGIAEQADNQNTIEFHLFQALSKTCLIESQTKCHYSRCGRTDKGVSSYGQVVNLIVKSNLIDESDPRNIGLFTQEGYSGPLNWEETNQRDEFNYVMMLNRVLPDNILILGWAPVKDGFSSRFNCKSRSYSYIFPVGDLCIQSMREALLYLVGEHDFRNFCSFDLKNGVTNHKRTILTANIKPISSSCDNTKLVTDPYMFYEVEIVGRAFLYHQIRCIMTIIFLVGSQKETPDIVKNLLDLGKCPSKPHYNHASPTPLCLTECNYDSLDLPLGWIFDVRALAYIVRQLKHQWLQHKTKTLMIERILVNLESSQSNKSREALEDCQDNNSKRPRLMPCQNRWADFGLVCDTMSDAKYVPLMKRPRGDTLESMIKTLDERKSKKAPPNASSP